MANAAAGARGGVDACLRWFFERLAEDAFSAGRREARAALGARAPALVAPLAAVEQAPACAPAVVAADAESGVLCFAALYFSARCVIESSYRYRHALALIDAGAACLDALATEHAEMAAIVRRFALLQGAVCEIDRGIYNGLVTTMAKAATRLAAAVAGLNARRAALDARAARLFDRHVGPMLDRYRIYADAIARIAGLYRLRWGDARVLARAIDNQSSAIQQAVDALDARNETVMASDLAAHLPVVRAFAASTRRDGELRVEHGHIDIVYFAVLGHDLLERVAELLAGPGAPGLALTGLGASAATSEPLADIWSGLAARDFVTRYRWQLPGLALPFRGRELAFDVVLVYYNMGAFALVLSAPLRRVSATGLRHAMSLGTPCALDEPLAWGPARQPFAFPAEFAEHVFTRLTAELERATHQAGQGAPALHWDSADNRFVTVRIDRVATRMDGAWRLLDPARLQQHAGYPALALTLQEVRSAVDDWIMRAPPARADNLAPLRYNAAELLVVAPHGAVVALLEQPDWVRAQAVESVAVAALVCNLLRVADRRLGERLRYRSASPTAFASDTRAPAHRLRARRDELHAQWLALERFEADVRWLLELIEVGAIMRYSDHTRLMRAVFAAMGFTRLHARVDAIMAEVKQRHRQILDQAAFVVDAARNRTARRMNAVLSGLLALLSIGALKDIFYLFNAANLGYTISGRLQIAVVLALIVVVAILLWARGGAGDD